MPQALERLRQRLGRGQRGHGAGAAAAGAAEQHHVAVAEREHLALVAFGDVVQQGPGDAAMVRPGRRRGQAAEPEHQREPPLGRAQHAAGRLDELPLRAAGLHQLPPFLTPSQGAVVLRHLLPAPQRPPASTLACFRHQPGHTLH